MLLNNYIVNSIISTTFCFLGCPPTNFGPLCNTTCPKNCHGPCDLVNGLCTYGCSNGWTGVDCKQGKTYFEVLIIVFYFSLQ